MVPSRRATLAFIALLLPASPAVAQDTVTVRTLRVARPVQPVVRMDVARLIQTGASARAVEQAWLQAVERERTAGDGPRPDLEATAAATLRAGVHGALAGPSQTARQSLWALGGALASDRAGRVAECRTVQQSLIDLLQSAPSTPREGATVEEMQAYMEAMERWESSVAGLEQQLEVCMERLESAEAGESGNDQGQMAQLDLQQAAQRTARALATLSNVAKTTHEAARAIINNMRP